jgi:CcmD family protein
VDATNLRFLFYGYTAAWIIVTVFVLMLIARGRRIDRELARLRALVEDKEAK